MPHALRVLLVLAALASIAAAEPLASTEATAGLGAMAVRSPSELAVTESALVVPHAGGRYVRGWFVTDGLLSAAVPVGATPMAASYVLAARVGVTLPHVTALVGAAMQLSPGSPAIQALPSVTVEAGTRSLRAVVGIADRPDLTELFRVGVAFGRFSISYLPLAGLEGTARVPLTGPFSLDARAFWFTFPGAGAMGADVGLVWIPGGAS